MKERRFDLGKYKAWLSSHDPCERGIAVAVLWHLGIRDNIIDSKIIAVLRTDNVEGNRRDAVRMIAGCQDPKFRNVLIEALDDDDWLIRGEALLGLVSIDQEITKDPRVARYIEEETHPYGRRCIKEIKKS
jgi:HEAT repeat protein